MTSSVDKIADLPISRGVYEAPGRGHQRVGTRGRLGRPTYPRYRLSRKDNPHDR